MAKYWSWFTPNASRPEYSRTTARGMMPEGNLIAPAEFARGPAIQRHLQGTPDLAGVTTGFEMATQRLGRTTVRVGLERWPRLAADRSGRMRVSVEKVCLQTFHPQRDVDRLAAWLRAPHVVRWWGDPAKQLHAVLERPVEGGDALIVADGVTVGYVRWQQAPRAELEAAGLHTIPEGSIDIDIAIGETDYIDRGVGSQALQLVVQRLRSEGSMPMIMMGTSVDNTMAISAFERAGFRRSRCFDDPEYGPAWLLVYQAPDL